MKPFTSVTLNELDNQSFTLCKYENWYRGKCFLNIIFQAIIDDILYKVVLQDKDGNELSSEEFGDVSIALETFNKHSKVLHGG